MSDVGLSFQLQTAHTAPLPSSQSQSSRDHPALGSQQFAALLVCFKTHLQSSESQEGKGHAEIIISDRPDFTVS